MVQASEQTISLYKKYIFYAFMFNLLLQLIQEYWIRWESEASTEKTRVSWKDNWKKMDRSSFYFWCAGKY